MRFEKLQEIINNIQSVRITVIGDFCLDAYWFIDESQSEVSIETGLMTRAVKTQKYSLGGAGNVTNNLAAMGVKDIRAFGIIGPDPFGNEMVDLMKKAGINCDNLLVQHEQWSTHVYSKPYISNQEQNRIDFGNFNRLSERTADQLISNLENEIPQTDVIIINQQVLSGIHTEYFRKRLVEVISQFPEKIFIADSRNYGDEYDGAYRKMNCNEAVRLCGIKKDPGEIVLRTEAVKAAKILFAKYKKPIFITRGSRGSVFIDETGVTEIFGLMIISKIDSVGAGDSYLAGVASTLAAGYPIGVAAEIGSFVAGVTIQKLYQTGTATPEEIIHLGADPDYIYSPELAEDIRQASHLKDTEIEIINHWHRKPVISHAIFDHDGTISTLREGWEHIMAPMMIKAILGKKYQDADEALYHKVQTRVQEFIDKTTGIQTLVQMKGLLDLIREFGCVPEKEMLDEFGYKMIYNNELLSMVREREKKLERGELAIEDFTIKNAVPLLHALFNAGIKLYLASGTDEDDLKNEAHILGYDYLFEGRIYGAVGDITKEAKKIVLDRILDTIGDSRNGQVVAFGDGPVEIRETHKRNGITVGVASNEIKRYGLSENKRTRLIKAGADIVVPDFSQLPQLLNLLNIK
jgi:rfaE bifunctional protein kinase chain/domain